MATSSLSPGDISLRDFIEAVGSAEGPHGAASTAAVAGGLGSSLLLMVAALPQTRSDSVADRAKLVEAAAALTSVQQQLLETIETETAVRLFIARSTVSCDSARAPRVCRRAARGDAPVCAGIGARSHRSRARCSRSIDRRSTSRCALAGRFRGCTVQSRGEIEQFH